MIVISLYLLQDLGMFAGGERVAMVVFVMLAAIMSSCAPILRERAVTIRTKPNFKRESVAADISYYTLDATGPDGQECSVIWPDDAPRPRRLVTNRIYKAEILEQERRSPVGDAGQTTWSPELVRISDGDRVLYDASICEVHRGHMERKLVSIFYGFPMFPREEVRARGKEFPNTGLVLGGCCVDSANPKTWTWVCCSCVASEKEWKDRSVGEGG